MMLLVLALPFLPPLLVLRVFLLPLVLLPELLRVLVLTFLPGQVCHR